jgi:hypothetical protein
MIYEDLTNAKFFIQGKSWELIGYTNALSPYFIYLVSFLFGVSEFILIYLNMLFFCLNILMVFLLSYFLTNDEKIGFLTCMLYIFIIGFIFNTSLWTYAIYISHLFTFLFILFSAIYFKIKKFSMFILALISLFIAADVRFEFILFLPALILTLLIIKRESLKKISSNKIIILIFFNIILFLGYFISFNVHFRYIGYENLLKKLLFFYSDIDFNIKKSFPNFIYFFTSYPFYLLTIFSVLSLSFLEKSKYIYLLIFCFIFLLLSYIFVNNFFQDRYGFYSISLLFPLSAISLNFYIGKFSKKISFKKDYIVYLLFSILMLFFISSNILFYKKFSGSPSNIISDEERAISDLIGQNDSYIIVSNYRFYIIYFLTMKNSESLENLIQRSDIFINKLENKDERVEFIARTMDGYSLNHNESYGKEIITKKIRIIENVLPEIEGDYLKGSNPLNLPTDKTIYFVEYPGCNNYKIQAMCNLLPKVFNTTLLYSSNGYKLYKISN